MAEASVQKMAIGRGLVVECSFPSFDSVRVVLRAGRIRVWHHVFDADNAGRWRSINLGLVRFLFRVTADMFTGQISWTRETERRSLRPWRWRVVGVKGPRVLVRMDPAIGLVGNETAAVAPVVDHPVFGKSQTCTPNILRIHVESQKRDLCHVGSVVKEQMFADRPPFVFNTVACVGAFASDRPGPYADPTSIWFNVFLGYYQLDCLKSEWSRPFGYEAPRGRDSVPHPDDIARLGKSDWNWFSNWNYGVPTDSVLPYIGVDMADIGFVNGGLLRIGNSEWHQIELHGVQVASCYQSAHPQAGKLVRNTILDDVWRRSFGAPAAHPDFEESFIPTTVDAKVDMAYWEDDAAFHTVLFGGTAATGADPAFLAAQIQATRAVIAASYPDLGF
jgi:hypothetical protein